MAKKKKKQTKIVDVNELDVGVVSSDDKVVRVEMPKEVDKVVPDLKAKVVRPSVPDTDLIVAETKPDPKFKRNTPEDLLVESTTYIPKADQVIKRMEIPEYSTEISVDAKKTDIRSSMPKIPEGATDSVSYVPGIETREVIKSSVKATAKVTSVDSILNQNPKVTVTSTDSHSDVQVTVETSGGALYVTTQDAATFKSSIKRPSDELNTLMDRASVSAKEFSESVSVEVPEANTSEKTTSKKSTKKSMGKRSTTKSKNKEK